MSLTVVVGTDKGGFVLRSDTTRQQWTIEGPLFKGWKVSAITRDHSGRFLLATASQVYGPAIHTSDDLENWTQVANGPSWHKSSERKLNQIWTIATTPSALYAGVDEAGLFSSQDGGETWSGVSGLNEHPSRSAWFPGAGGMCAHVLLSDPENADRLWCGISAVGVFRSDDGGSTWHPRNEGIPILIEDKCHKDIGRCVHGMVADPTNADIIYRREHTGMFRTTNGGDSWERIQNGLEHWFGFPIGIDRRGSALFTIPLESDEYRVPADGKLIVYRSTDGGNSWQPLTNGLPQANCYLGVLRGAMAVDRLEPCGVYFATTGGTVHISPDAGETWQQLPCLLPRALCCEVFEDV